MLVVNLYTLFLRNNSKTIATEANIYLGYRNFKWSQIDIMRPEKKKKVRKEKEKKQGSTKGLGVPSTRGSAVRSRGVWSRPRYSLSDVRGGLRWSWDVLLYQFSYCRR
jgi:hypothetical protein